LISKEAKAKRDIEQVAETELIGLKNQISEAIDHFTIKVITDKDVKAKNDMNEEEIAKEAEKKARDEEVNYAKTARNDAKAAWNDAKAAVDAAELADAEAQDALDRRGDSSVKKLNAKNAKAALKQAKYVKKAAKTALNAAEKAKKDADADAGRVVSETNAALEETDEEGGDEEGDEEGGAEAESGSEAEVEAMLGRQYAQQKTSLGGAATKEENVVRYVIDKNYENNNKPPLDVLLSGIPDQLDSISDASEATFTSIAETVSGFKGQIAIIDKLYTDSQKEVSVPKLLIAEIEDQTGSNDTDIKDIDEFAIRKEMDSDIEMANLDSNTDFTTNYIKYLAYVSKKESNINESLLKDDDQALSKIKALPKNMKHIVFILHLLCDMEILTGIPFKMNKPTRLIDRDDPKTGNLTKKRRDRWDGVWKQNVYKREGETMGSVADTAPARNYLAEVAEKRSAKEAVEKKSAKEAAELRSKRDSRRIGYLTAHPPTRQEAADKRSLRKSRRQEAEDYDYADSSDLGAIFEEKLPPPRKSMPLRRGAYPSPVEVDDIALVDGKAPTGGSAQPTQGNLHLPVPSTWSGDNFQNQTYITTGEKARNKATHYDFNAANDEIHKLHQATYSSKHLIKNIYDYLTSEQGRGDYLDMLIQSHDYFIKKVKIDKEEPYIRIKAHLNSVFRKIPEKGDDIITTKADINSKIDYFKGDDNTGTIRKTLTGKRYAIINVDNDVDKFIYYEFVGEANATPAAAATQPAQPAADAGDTTQPAPAAQPAADAGDTTQPAPAAQPTDAATKRDEKLRKEGYKETTMAIKEFIGIGPEKKETTYFDLIIFLSTSHKYLII